MSISQAISNAQQKVADAYTAISNKGGTLPATQDLANMPTAIGTITQTNLTTLSVTTNGTYTPTSPYNGFSQVDVSVNAVNNNALSITPTTSAQNFTVSAPYTGYNPITVSAVTSAIDSNIQPQFIRNGVEILSVVGTYGEPVPPPQIFCSASSTWYIDNNNILYGCGNNSYGQQGSGDTTNVTTFTQRATNVKMVECNFLTTWYVTNDGNLYGCGGNSSGQQGSGDTTNVTTFTQRATNVKQVICSIGGNSTWYIDNNNILYGCGGNSSGQQGSGDTTNVTTFTQRATNVKMVACDDYSTTWYIDNNNILYGCGGNSSGQQGSGDTTNVTTFTQRATNVKMVGCSQSRTWYIDNNDVLYYCGSSFFANAKITTFTQLATNVKKVIFGFSVSVYYLTNDGILFGKEGSNYNAISQIATNVKDFAISSDTFWYIDNNDVLYGCGNNSYGQQGSGDTTNVTTFTQRATNVKMVSVPNGNANNGATTGYTTSEDVYLCGSGMQGQQGNGKSGNYLANVKTFTKRN